MFEAWGKEGKQGKQGRLYWNIETWDRGGKQGKEGTEGIMDRALRQVLAHGPMGQKVQTWQIGLISLFGT